MNPLKSLCFVACILAVACASSWPGRNSAHRGNSLSNSLKPTEWLTISQLESLPSVDQVTLEQLERMSNIEGAELINQLYHLSQINYELMPNYTPNMKDIPVYVMKPNGHNVSTTLDQLVATAKQQPSFGDEEVTIFITGLPPNSKTITRTNENLVRAYQMRYNGQQQWQHWQHRERQQHPHNSNERTSSEEDYNEANPNSRNSNKKPNGNLVIIDLGAALTSFERLVMLDVDRTGNMIGKLLVQLTNQLDVPHEIIHIVAQGIGAHVAGVAGRQFTRYTGHQLRRITALDPAKIFAKQPNTITGLARGDAEFVDAIHTSAYGMGTTIRVGDVDFYPNGPSVAVPGTDNIVEASMRATRYFTESVVPGMERNFPAVAANSLNEYKNNDGYGQRVYMGIDTDFDLEGDFILQVNAQSPFGKAAPAQKQNSYHSMHSVTSRNSHKNNQNNEN